MECKKPMGQRLHMPDSEAADEIASSGFLQKN
jgi:hypothetical protein